MNPASSLARRFSGFAVIERPEGALIWGTFRPARADAWAAYTRYNPAAPDHEPQGQLVEVEMTIKPVSGE